MINYSIYSQNQEKTIFLFDKFDKEIIKKYLFEALKEDSKDTLELHKETSKKNNLGCLGGEILDFFQISRNGELCKIVTKGNKEFLKKIL